VSDLNICRAMHWTYTDLLQLPAEVYDILVAQLIKDAEK